MSTENTVTETKSACTREISVEIPADVVTQQTEIVVQKYQKLARLPGFRRGKVPATIIRNRFADDVRNEVVEALVPKFFREEVKKQGLEPVSAPQVLDMQLHEGEPLRFKASFEVLPEIEVSGYKELRSEKQDTSVSDDEVEQAIQRLREQQATFVAVEEDRSLADGDFAQASFSGVAKDPQPGEQPVKMDEVMVEIGGTNTVREFSDNLRGAKPGEERRFEVTYADDFADERLRGKTMAYQVAVKGIKRKELPALDDNFAKELGEFESVDDLRKRIRENMEEEKRHRSEHAAKDKLVDELVRRHEFPIPEALVDRQIDVRLERGLRALAAQGMRTEDIKKMDFGRLRAGQREAAVKEVKASLLLDKIADVEHIEVKDEEIENEIEALARQTKQPPEAVRSRLTREGALDRIRNRLRNEKALDFLYRSSA